jgi:cell division protein FtsZ
MGGGTGTGAAPVVAKVAHDMDILTIGIVTKPFDFEGRRRMLQAEQGIEEFSKYVDSLVVIPNERLKFISENRITLFNAFSEADDILRKGVQSISELINIPGFINLDFADVTSVMNNSGLAHMGIGSGTGKDKAEIAAKAAISSPLLETSIHGAMGVIISISASPDIGLEDVDLAAGMVRAECNEDANIIFGVGFDDNLSDEMRITIVATGFTKDGEQQQKPATFKSAFSTKTEEPKAKAKPASDDFLDSLL